MRIVQFKLKSDDKQRLGVQLGDENGEIVEVKDCGSTLELLQGGSEKLSAIQSYAESYQGPRLNLSDVRLMSPITKPDKVICIGMNYKDHCEEQNFPIPKEPLVFNKFPSTICGPSDDIPYPEVTTELDWEVELAIVVGKGGKDISRKAAMDHIFGFTVAHDVSARDWQLKGNGGQWLAGKAMDRFCPLGPAIVTTDEIGDPHNLDLKCLVNGAVKQDSNTGQLIFKCQEIISWCSMLFTLLPGDVILTGTPPGVGVFAKPPEFLKKDDKVECWIQKVGTITNKII